MQGHVPGKSLPDSNDDNSLADASPTLRHRETVSPR
jgi:hypothetical protein